MCGGYVGVRTYCPYISASILTLFPSTATHTLMPHPATEYFDRNTAVLTGQIDILERQGSELRALLNALTLQKRSLEVERHNLETERIPINWLPPELLIHIFVFVTYTAFDPTQSQLDIVPLHISHVCQRWRDIALSTPALWRRVVLTPSDMSSRRSVSLATQTFLERSKGIPTEVFYAVPPGKANPLTPRIITALRRREQQQLVKSHLLDIFPPLRSLFIHGHHDIIVDALAYLHNYLPGFAHLESLELALECATPAELYDGLLLNDPVHAYCNPWRTRRFPTLQALTLRDIPLSCVALGQLPALREITLTLDTPLSGSLEFLRLPYFARLLACAPHVEHLAILRAGPVFSLPLDPSPEALHCWEDDAAWRADGSKGFPPVPLEQLRELEWTDAHPDTLLLLLMHFPTPRLEVLDIAFAGANKCKKLAALLHPTFVDVRDSAAIHPVLELSNLKVLRADCSSGDTLRSPFLPFCFPALETLSLSNRNLSVHRIAGPRSVDDELNKLPQLPRLESIFRDPRMPHLTHLLLSGFAISPEQASLMLGYMPSLQRLDCNFVPNIAAMLDALAAARSVGVRVCPRLRHIQLWCCDGVESATLVRLVKLRNGLASGAEIASRDNVAGRRPIKRLPKGAHIPVTGSLPGQPMRTNDEWQPAKIEQVSVEGCRPISGKEAVSLSQWGVGVQWIDPCEQGLGVLSRP
jgi:F-box-like